MSARRGTALLLVLATLVLVVTAAAALARSLALHRIESDSFRTQLVGDRFVRDATPRIESWLAAESALAVMLPDAETPAIPMDRITLDEGLTLSITAFDLRGMAPAPLVAAGGPITRTLPPEVVHAVRTLDDLTIGDDEPLGLDGFSRASSSTLPVYPRLGDTGAIGGLVAFDVPSARGAVPLNVNTAPWPLVALAMRDSGRGGLDLIRERRAEGKPANVTGTAREGADASTATRTELIPVAVSDAWAFRVEATSGGTMRAWWVVYRRERAGWRCTHRVPIDG